MVQQDKKDSTRLRYVKPPRIIILKAISTFLLGLILAFVLSYPSYSARHSIDKNTCSFQGIPLYGDVKIVNHFPDIKIREVNHFPDLNVEIVTSFPNRCGKWKWVEHFPDFTVKYVNHFPDIDIKEVTSFPGIP